MATNSWINVLGGLNGLTLHSLTDGDDFNSCTSTGIYNADNSKNVSNRPGTGSCDVICIARSGTQWLQIAYNFSGDIYIRRCWGGTPNAWKQL